MSTSGNDSYHASATSSNQIVVPSNNQLKCFMTILRNASTTSKEFSDALEPIAAQVMLHALELVPVETFEVSSPTGVLYSGVRQSLPICGVSILRAGASLEGALRKACSGPVTFGKILIQRDEETCLPKFLYSKFPKDVGESVVFILEPMLATGGSASKAVEIVLEQGVREGNVVFVNILASKKGIDRLSSTFPDLRIVTAAIDEELSDAGYILPGLGDFGDRYYGTL